MRRVWVLAFASFSLLAAPATAQGPKLPAVDTMTCDQLNAEMITASMQVAGKLGPNYGADAQALQADLLRGGTNQANDTARMQALQGQALGSVQGLDLQRMSAISARVTALKCPLPVPPSPH